MGKPEGNWVIALRQELIMHREQYWGPVSLFVSIAVCYDDSYLCHCSIEINVRQIRSSVHGMSLLSFRRFREIAKTNY